MLLSYKPLIPTQANIKKIFIRAVFDLIAYRARRLIFVGSLRLKTPTFKLNLPILDMSPKYVKFIFNERR